MRKHLKKIISSVIFSLMVITGVALSEYFPDVIVTSPNGAWTDTRAYSSINSALSAIGANARDIYILRQEVTSNLTIPATARLHFMRSGSIANTGQLTINTKDINAGNYQIFTGVGNIDFASGSILRTSWFNNIETSFALTTNDSVTLIVSKPQTITGSYSPGTNVHLKWDGPGNILTVNPGVVIGNLKHIEAGRYQIFAGAGDLDFSDGTILKSSWFNSLRAITDWIESEKVNLIIDNSSTVDFSITLPENISIQSEPGNVTTVATGIVLTIHGHFKAGNYQTFNCAGTGLVQGGIRQDYISPYWFGAIPWDDTVGAANYIAIRKALAYALSIKDRVGADRLGEHPELRFTAGKWWIKGNSPFCFTRTEMESLPGAYRYRQGFKVSGTGMHSTVLILENDGTSHTWFYSSDDPAYPATASPPTDRITDANNSSVMDYVEFSGITFRNFIGYEQDRKYVVAEALKTSGFHFRSYGMEKYMRFERCAFEGLDTAFKFSGYGNADHNQFTDCRFRGIIDTVFDIDNNQSVATKLNGCNIEHIFGNGFKVGRWGGGDVSMFGGSIILDSVMKVDGMPDLTSTTIRALVNHDLTGIASVSSYGSGIGNNRFTFHGVRFELYDKYQRLYYAARSAGTFGGALQVHFYNSSMAVMVDRNALGGIVTPTATRDVVTFSGPASGLVTFDSCDLHVLATYSISGYLPAANVTPPAIIFNQCRCYWEWYSSSYKLTIDTRPTTQWSVGDTITGGSSGVSCTITSIVSKTVFRVSTPTGAFTDGEILTNGVDAADQGVGYPIVSNGGSVTLDERSMVDTVNNAGFISASGTLISGYANSTFYRFAPDFTKGLGTSLRGQTIASKFVALKPDNRRWPSINTSAYRVYLPKGSILIGLIAIKPAQGHINPANITLNIKQQDTTTVWSTGVISENDALNVHYKFTTPIVVNASTTSYFYTSVSGSGDHIPINNDGQLILEYM